MDQVLCGICAPSGSGNYQRDIRQFLFSHRSETETDLVIFSGDKSFQVHQAVILPLSDHLRELLPPSCPCTKPAIYLPPFPSHVLTAAIEILYTGTTTIPGSQEDQIKVKEVFALLKIKADVDRDINIEATKKKIFQQVEEDLEAMFAYIEDSDTVKRTKTKTSSESPLDEPKENKGELSTGTVVSKGVTPKNEPNDFSAIPENGQKMTPPHQDIHSCYLNEVTGEFYKDERENVLVLENHDKEPSSCFKYIQSQGQTAPKMILNEATGVFCYDERQNTSGLDEFENCIINHQKNVEIVTENKDVTPKLHNNENESVKKHEYDITKCPKQAFGSEEEHPLISSQTPKLTARKRKTKEPDEVRKGIKRQDRNLLSSVSKPQTGNKKMKVTGLDGSNCESVIKSEHRNGKQKSSSKFACSKCDYTNKRKDNLKRHIDGVHKKILYNCNECDYTTTWKITLKSHIDGVHKNILYKCKDCDYTTNMKENLKRHIDGLHKKILYNCNECDYTTTWESSLKRHIDGVHKNILCKCDDCDYTTNRKINLKRHIDGVHKKMLYNCNECDYTTTWKTTLKRHIDGVHKNIWFKCEDCDYTTKKKENLKRHIHAAHENIYFNCDQCEFKTMWKTSLKSHINAHKKIYFKCDQCDYETTWKGTFKRHIQGVHDSIVYKCNQCNFTTTWKEHLQRHIKSMHAGVSLPGSQCNTKAVNKPTARSRKSVHREVAANYCTRSQKMSLGAVAAVNSIPRVSENPSPRNDKAEEKRFQKKSKTKGDASFLW